MATATRSRPTTQDQIDLFVATLYAKRSKWDEEYCWRLLRETFPGLTDESLAWWADRVQHQMEFGAETTRREIDKPLNLGTTDDTEKFLTLEMLEAAAPQE